MWEEEVPERKRERTGGKRPCGLEKALYKYDRKKLGGPKIPKGKSHRTQTRVEAIKKF